MARLRVVQWTTGKVGRLALRAILDDPRLELVGVYAYSADKRGQDAGALCGRPDSGVAATDDIEALIALAPDTVIYTPFMADLGHAVRLLEAGVDVVSTNLFLNVGGIQGETKALLEAACAKGGASLHITGVNPGWINAAAAAMTAVCRAVDCVTIAETADCSTYASPETWTAMGMGVADATPEVLATAKLWMTSFQDAARRLADALGHTLDTLDFAIEYATAARDIDLGWFRMPQGTNAALRAGWEGKAGGKVVVRTTVAWYLSKDLAEGWTFDDEHYHLIVEGEPGVDARIRFLPPDHWQGGDFDTMTALPAVNAALAVAAAPPGILTLAEAGLVVAPAAAWAGR